MGVSYLKLREILRISKIKHYMIHDDTGITHDELAKINKDQYMTLQSAEIITRYLSEKLDKQFIIEDLMEFKKP